MLMHLGFVAYVVGGCWHSVKPIIKAWGLEAVRLFDYILLALLGLALLWGAVR